MLNIDFVIPKYFSQKYFKSAVFRVTIPQALADDKVQGHLRLTSFYLQAFIQQSFHKKFIK